MVTLIRIAALLAAFSVMTLAQQPAPTGDTPAQRQKNANSATQDNSATSGDQITPPAAAKGSTLIGCLVGPDKDGKYMLRNMGHRFGVEVVGPNDLKNDAGGKVKLTGQWQPLPPDQQNKKAGQTQRFQATDIELMAPNCKPPGETTPASKNKQQKPTTYDAPSAEQPK